MRCDNRAKPSIKPVVSSSIRGGRSKAVKNCSFGVASFYGEREGFARATMAVSRADARVVLFLMAATAERMRTMRWHGGAGPASTKAARSIGADGRVRRLGIPGLIGPALRRCADVNPASSACKTFVRAVRQPAFQVARRLPRCSRALSRRPSTKVIWLNPTEREATESPVVQGFVIPALSSRDWWLRHACGCAQSIAFRAQSRGAATRHRGEWGRIGRGTPACVAGGEFLSNAS